MTRFLALRVAVLALLAHAAAAAFAGAGEFTKMPAQTQQIHHAAGDLVLPMGVELSLHSAGSPCEAVKAEAVRARSGYAPFVCASSLLGAAVRPASRRGSELSVSSATD